MFVTLSHNSVISLILQARVVCVKLLMNPSAKCCTSLCRVRSEFIYPRLDLFQKTLINLLLKGVLHWFALSFVWNPVVFLNDHASLPHFSLRRESSVFLWCKMKVLVCQWCNMTSFASLAIPISERNTDFSLLRDKWGRDVRSFKNTTGFLFIQSFMQISEVPL